MGLGLYLKCAIEGIKKNRKIYIPYILTSSVMFSMCHIIYALKDSKSVAAVSFFVSTGFFPWVFAFFSGLVLFYTNSFLIKRRKKEFGLYNVLGMNKCNISKILFFETLIISVVVIIFGLIGGFLLYKLAEALLLNILGGDIDYQLIVSSDASIWATIVFLIIFVCIFLNSLRQIRFSNAISLVKSGNLGEKPPKSNMIFGIIGFLLLIGAYILILSVPQSEAIYWLFISIILVIISTYIIMISSSIFIVKILKKNKKYYYKSNHFISISSMMYRIKRNGAGLASICILLTMIQFIMSVCIYVTFVTDDMIRYQYPQQNTQIKAYETDIDRLFSDDNLKIKREIIDFAKNNDVKLTNYLEYRNASAKAYSTSLYGDTINMNSAQSLNNGDEHRYIQFEIIPIEDYNKNMGTNETLNYGEAVVYMLGAEYDKDTISFACSDDQKKTFKIVDKQLEPMKVAMSWHAPKLVILVSDIGEVKEIENMISSCGEESQNILLYSFHLRFDIDCPDYKTKEFIKNFRDKTYDIRDNLRLRGIVTDNYYQSKNVDFKDIKELLFVSVFFIILLVLIVILIMYYKQVYEGYEDANGFNIMKNVGISKKEIKKSVNSQLLITFFAPLTLTALHTIFSTIMLYRIMNTNVYHDYTAFFVIIAISFILLSILYCIMYKVTSKVYYNIVGGVNKN